MFELRTHDVKLCTQDSMSYNKVSNMFRKLYFDIKYVPILTSFKLYEFNLLCCNVDVPVKIDETCVALNSRMVGVKLIL
jgi:hypothetical protein